MSTPTRHDDLNELRGKQFRIPTLFRQGAWLTVPAGRPTLALGPAGTQLLLWLPIADIHASSPSLTWNEIDAVVGAPRGATSRAASAQAMDALLPGHDALDKSIDGDQWIIYGTEYPVDAFGNIFWKHGWTLGLSSGLLVSLTSD